MSDEVNILSGMMAKKLGARYVAASVRNPDYSMQKGFLRTEMRLNMIINLEKGAVKEMRCSIVFKEVMITYQCSALILVLSSERK